VLPFFGLTLIKIIMALNVVNLHGFLQGGSSKNTHVFQEGLSMLLHEELEVLQHGMYECNISLFLT
jgi:hypothetical protein